MCIEMARNEGSAWFVCGQAARFALSRVLIFSQVVNSKAAHRVATNSPPSDSSNKNGNVVAGDSGRSLLAHPRASVNRFADNVWVCDRLLLVLLCRACCINGCHVPNIQSVALSLHTVRSHLHQQTQGHRTKRKTILISVSGLSDGGFAVESAIWEPIDMFAAMAPRGGAGEGIFNQPWGRLPDP